MKKKYYIIVTLGILGTSTCFAQKEVRQLLRKGNALYKDSLFVDAEVDYRKAIDISPKEEVGMSYYNLGSALVSQSKFEEAIKEFARASEVEVDKTRKSESLHNIGAIFQADKQLDKAIDAYKEALRNNPKDDQTRYNLALALKQKNEQDQNQEGKDDQEQKDKEQDKNEQNENKNQDQQQQQNKNQDKKQEKEEDQNQSQGGKSSQSLSKEAAEQMLNAIMRDEKKTQEKVQKQQVLRGKNKLEKDW